MHVGPHRRVLGLLKCPLGQRHLAGRLLSHFWGLREPLRLALQVKKAIALSSLLKPRQHAGQSPHEQASLPSIGVHLDQCSTEKQNHQACHFTRATKEISYLTGVWVLTVFFKFKTKIFNYCIHSRGL